MIDITSMNMIHCFLNNLIILFTAVKYEAWLEDGTLISKSDGVEFTVKDGLSPFLFDICVHMCVCTPTYVNELLQVTSIFILSFGVQAVSALPWQKL